MDQSNLITLRNKKTGEIVKVPRSQYVESEPLKGLPGIGSDIGSSLESAWPALGKMITSIPEGINNVGDYATTNNPVNTLANLGAGATEAGAGLLSSPQILMRYLADKFPQFGKRLLETNKTAGQKGSFNDPTFYERLKSFENQIGFEPKNEQEASVRNAGGLLGGGKLLTALPNALSRIVALSGASAGTGGDPIHAAIMGLTGEMLAKAPWNKAKQIPQATANVVKNIPEVAGKTAASTLESLADYGSKLPMGASVLQPTMGALASYLKHISVPPEELAQRNLFGDITSEDIPEMEERNDAAKRLGLSYVTPSELLNSPFESVKQANVGRTTSGMKKLYKSGIEREGTEEGAINKLINLIHEDKLEPEKKAAYEQTMKANVSDDFIQRQMNRPVIQKAVKSLEGEPAYKQRLQEELGIELGDVKPTSFRYWDLVKRVLGDMEEGSKEQGKTTTKSDTIGDTRRSMVKEMDAIEPAYKQARKIAERKKTREKVEKIFDKLPKTFNNFDRFLKSKQNYDSLMSKLESFPEAQQQLKDIKSFSGKMIPNNPTVRAAAALKRVGMSDARNAIEAKKREFDEKYGQEHDVAGVNLMTNPDLMTLLKQYLEKNGK